MSPTEKAALLWHHANETPNEQLADAMDAGAAAIDAAEALRKLLAGVAHDSTHMIVNGYGRQTTDAEREAARRLLGVLGGE